MATVDPLILHNYVKSSGLKFRENTVSFIFVCPRCNKKDKLYIRKRDGQFVCWKCKETDGYRGRCEYALADLLGIPAAEVASDLYGARWAPAALQIDVDIKDWCGEGDDLPEESETILERVAWPWNFFPLDDPRCVRGLEYLCRKRGVPLEVAQQYGVKYCPELRQVIFPVQMGGRLLGWQGRVVYNHRWIDDEGVMHEGVKSFTSHGLRAEKVLMFADRLADVDHAVVCEGPIDALKAHLCGGNVCTMGKGVSPFQINLLRNSGKRKIYLGLDPDAAEDTARCVRALDSDLEVYVFPELPTLPNEEKADLGALSMEEVYDLYQRSRRVSASHLFVFLKPFRG